LAVKDDDSESLFSLMPTEWQELHWEGMPSFQHSNLEPRRSLLVHFKTDEDVREFCKLLKLKVTDRTKYVWYPDVEREVYADKVWKAARPLNPTYPVYVISKGRWESRLTVKALEVIGVPYHVVIEPQEYESYSSVIDPAKIYTLPFSNLGKGSIPARNWVWEHAISIGARRHWILDDNIRDFFYYHDNSKIRVGDGTCFAAIEQWVDQWENIRMAGMQYHTFAPRRKGWEHKPLTLNTRVYSCILLDNSITHRWRGRYNEDTDLSIRILKDGDCTALFYVFLIEKMATMTMRGGNTDQLYVDDGRLKMAESLREQHPDIVHVTTKWGRPQHHVNYKVFKYNRLVRREGADAPDLADIMELKPQDPKKRLAVSTLKQEPVVVTVKKSRTQQGGDEGGQSTSLLSLAAAQEPVAQEPVAQETADSALLEMTKTGQPPGQARVATAKEASQGQQDALAQGPVSIGVRPRRFAEVSVRPREQWVHPFLKAHQATLASAGAGKIPLDESNWDNASTSAVGFDVEVFENFFVACFKRFSDGKRLAFELSERSELDRAALREVLTKNLVVTFNGSHFDVPLAWYALSGASCGQLKDACNKIISGQMRGWDVARTLGIRVPAMNHVDLMEPNPSVRQSLKMVSARLHARYLVDLPFEPSVRLTREQMNVTTLYCLNDVDCTKLLYEALREPLELREVMGKEYKTDFRSKSDAQIGEAIVRSRVESHLGRRVTKPPHSGPFTFRYKVPPFLSFQSEKLRSVCSDLEGADFVVNGLGKVETPQMLLDLQVPLGGATYSMGIGGLHSTEAHRSLRSDSSRVLVDIDVASQYPNIILKLGMYPKALGPKFLDVYSNLVAERLAAKAAGDKVKADTGKIAANGVFGKLGSSHSVLFSPEMFIATTLTGQLSILMLIEKAEGMGVQAVSANTDGVIFYCPRDRGDQLSHLLRSWEEDTGFTVEESRYSALYSSSVNTYIAVSESGKVKRKGPIADPWSEGDLRGQMSKNPQMTACSEAVLRLVTDQTPIPVTVQSCSDPRRFVTVIKADGATWRGNQLGRVARYYWSTDGDPIYAGGGARKVPKTDGARPLLELTDELPGDIDYQKYIDEACKLAVELGAIDQDTLLSRSA
jgi:hypothetical protein